MASYALIKDKKVFNTIVWAGPKDSPMDFGDGITYAEIPDDTGTNPSIGWGYEDSKFVEPPMTEEEIDDLKSQNISNNLSIKSNLIAEATQDVVPLQTKLLLGRKLTAAETEKLNKILDYIDALNDIDANADKSILWPVKP